MRGEIGEASSIPGLRYLQKYISKGEEGILLERLDTYPWRTELQRRVQHYGYIYAYFQRTTQKGPPFPAELEFLRAKLVADGLFETLPNSGIVNEYLPGQGISPHIDCAACFGETICSLSLNASCCIEFLRDGRKLQKIVEPRSLLVLQGEARYQWKHAIARRKQDLYGGIKIVRTRRLSVTFRMRRLDSDVL